MVTNDLLQALEHTVDEVRRLSQLAYVLLDAHQKAEVLPPETITAFWQQIGRTEAQ